MERRLSERLPMISLSVFVLDSKKHFRDDDHRPTDYSAAKERLQHCLVISRLARGVLFLYVFYITYGFRGGTGNKINVFTANYDNRNKNVIVKPTIQISNSNAGIINIVGREAVMVDDDVMSFSEIEIISTGLRGKADRGYLNSKTNEIIMLDRPKFEIYRKSH